MAFITMDAAKLQHNYKALDQLFKPLGIQWAIVSKMLCGNKTYLEQLIKLGTRQLCDSRVTNLRTIKSIDSSVETIYIKPPAKQSIDEIIEVADISFNTEIDTIELLNKAARRKNKIHKIIIMIEMGELREGVMGEELLEFYKEVFELPNIEVVGIGTNLTCMYGVLPSHDKLIQLGLYKQLIETMFGRDIPSVSGGSSVTIPLIFQNLLPAGINHFRVGETLYLGTDVYNNTTFETMSNDVFQLHAEIIEINEKRKVPIGELGLNLTGDKLTFSEEDMAYSSYRAIIDLGLLDIDDKNIKLIHQDLSIVGASSDVLVIDLGENERNYQIGDLIEFELNYMGILRIMNSKYIEKRVKNPL